MPEIEIRSIKTEVRTKESGDDKIIEGYAAVFDTPALISDWMGTYREYVRSGAFAKTLQENKNIKGLHQHDPRLVLGSVSNNTLVLGTDTCGLAFKAMLPKTTYASDLWESVKRGDVDQCSFGFRTMKDNWYEEKSKDEKGNQVVMMARDLLEVQLIEVTVTPFGAYEQTQASARSIDLEGMSFETLSGVLFRASKGLELNEEGKEILKRGMNILQKYAEPGNHSKRSQQPEPSVSLSRLRADLDILALQI